MRLDLGIASVRPLPGACLFLAGDVLVLRREWASRTAGHITRRAAAVLALTSCAAEDRADEMLHRIVDAVAPQMEFGRHAMTALAEALDTPANPEPVDGALAWTDGTRVRVAFRGHFRCVLLRAGRAERLPPHEDRSPGWAEVAMAADDWFILAPPATDAALPLGSILALAKDDQDATNVCRTAATQAGAADPLNHHAVLALRIGTGP